VDLLSFDLSAFGSDRDVTLPLAAEVLVFDSEDPAEPVVGAEAEISGFGLDGAQQTIADKQQQNTSL
jgi:hypothetical protein